MLEKLSKKDKLWRQIAFNICKCKDLADELTSLMYLRIYNYDIPEEKQTESYIGFVIYNLFRDHCKKQPHISIDEFYDITDETPVDSFTDYDLSILEKANELRWWERQLLILSYDKSSHQIQREYHINYQYTLRHVDKAKKQVLGEDYKTNKNGRVN